jgi:hypothetical protein
MEELLSLKYYKIEFEKAKKSLPLSFDHVFVRILNK